MEFVTLKNSDLTVSRFCMGGCPMGGYGWGEVNEKELLDSIELALDMGVNFFDTADTYGLGQSEIILGKGLGQRRDRAVISTKFGVRVEQGGTFYDNSPEYIRKALENSLRRLNTDYIDLYTIHYRDGVTAIEDVVDALEGLKSEKKIRYYGLSNIHQDGIAELLPYRGKFVSCQDEFSLVCRKNELDLKTVKDTLDVSPMTWGSLGQGILTGKYTTDNIKFGSDDRRSRNVYENFHGEKLKKNLSIVEAMKPMAKARGKPISAIAIRFILDWLEDSVVLVGAKRPSQILGNIKAMDWKLTREELYMLDKLSISSKIGGGRERRVVYCAFSAYTNAVFRKRRAA